MNIHGSVVSAREIVLSTEGVAAGYDGDDIISNISVAVEHGSIFTVIGPNGSGKSTFIKVLAGLLPARTGEIRLGATSIARLSAPQRVAAGLAYVPQEFNVFANLTVEENLRLGLAARRGRNEVAQDLARIYDLFPAVRESLRRNAGALSGGQQQQLAIARALLARPTVLLLDEPSLGLAPTVVQAVFGVLHEIREHGVTILLVEQRAEVTIRAADRTHVLANGELRLSLTPADAGDTERLAAAYLS